MSKLGKKIVPAVSVLAVLGAALVLAGLSGLPLAKAVDRAVHDPSPAGLTLVLNAFAITFSGTIAIFILGRWAWVVDETTSLKNMLAEELGAMKQTLERALSLLAEKGGVRLVVDDAALWSGLVVRLISENPTFLAECAIQIVAGGRFRMILDPPRLANFLERLCSDMELTYVFYLPRSVVGENPAVSLLRLVHIVRVCRTHAAAQGKKLQATLRIIIVDSPRPAGSIFIGTQETDGTVRPFAREYFRSINPQVRADSPVAGRMILAHHDPAAVQALEALVSKSASKGVEVDFEDVEHWLGELLPQNDGETAPIISSRTWTGAVKAIYRGAEAHAYEFVDLYDGSFKFSPIEPSLTNERGRGRRVSDAPSCDQSKACTGTEAPRPTGLRSGETKKAHYGIDN